jgi:acyl-coenzyme A synthetase/AMP-(fatty) acid ligase
MEQSRFPDVKYTLSATAPLPKHLAKQVEALFHTTIVEIYGFAEAGSIATRRPIQEDSWTLLPELTLVSHTNGYAVSTPYFSDPVPIPDTIQSANPQQFTLEGRPGHLINIGGHRASLDALNAQRETSDSILTTLRTKMAPVFLPRPIYLVDALPRNHTGKLVKEDVETLLRTQTNPANTPQQ